MALLEPAVLPPPLSIRFSVSLLPGATIDWLFFKSHHMAGAGGDMADAMDLMKQATGRLEQAEAVVEPSVARVGYALSRLQHRLFTGLTSRHPMSPPPPLHHRTNTPPAQSHPSAMWPKPTSHFNPCGPHPPPS